MSPSESIFSDSSSGNDKPTNPFASLSNGNGTANAPTKSASPFATPPESSPFGISKEQNGAAPALPSASSASDRGLSQMPESPFSESKPANSETIKPEPQEKSPSLPPSSPFMRSDNSSQKPSQDFGLEATPLPVAAELKESAPAESAPEPESSATPPNSPFGFAASSSPAAPAEPAPVESASIESAPAPAESFSPAPAAAASIAPVAAAVSSAPSLGNGGSNQSTRQLELRAIFGVEGEMSRNQILEQAKGLSGIRDLAVVGPGELSAIQTMGGVMSRFGYGDSSSWQLTCAGGVVDFISSEGATLAVLREGRYSAGVWETLMIVARELGKI